MTAIYLAARFERKPELQAYRKELERIGHRVTSRWLNDHQHEWHGVNDEHIPHTVQAEFAREDLEDIDAAEVFVLFTDPMHKHGRRGGKMVEFGYAIAKGKAIIIAGDVENIFCCLDGFGYAPVRSVEETARRIDTTIGLMPVSQYREYSKPGDPCWFCYGAGSISRDGEGWETDCVYCDGTGITPEEEDD